MADVPTSSAASPVAGQSESAPPAPVSNGVSTPAEPVISTDGAVADEAVAAAERIAFLALASELARGRNVLVVDDGASALAGIAAHLDSSPIGQLETPADGAYDLVVADLLAADAEASAGVPQLSRVVSAENGIALVRLPNRPEFAPLRAALEQTFALTLSMRQHNWVSSAIFDDAMFQNDEPAKAVAASVRKLAAAEIGEELYTVVICAQKEFPDFRPQLAVTRSLVLRNLIEELVATRESAVLELADVAQQNKIQGDRIRELEEELAWYDERELALRAQIEERGWATALVDLWARALAVSRRARNVLRGR